ncbi:MAG: penicillin acylase family protein [Myxococcota bacterium]
MSPPMLPSEKLRAIHGSTRCSTFGLNYFLHTHPEVRPKVLQRFEPWMALSFSEGSIGGDIERVDLSALAEFYGKSPKTAADGLRPKDGEPSGSNGIAIGPRLAKDGASLLLINPHTSFFFRHEAHVTSQEGLNAYGALTWGQFFVYQGFNETAGWMHTSSSVDNIDEFVEAIGEKDGALFYRYGDEERPVLKKTVTVKCRQGDTIGERVFDTYGTHHGPIVRSQDGKWVAVALMERPMKALIQSYTRTKAKNLDEYLAIMEQHTNSSNNTVFADAEGNIAYLHSNFVPVRDPYLDYRKPVDGSDPATDWRGVHTLEESPNSINPPNGWVQNTNNWPYSAAGEYSPRYADFPAYMDIGAENQRGVHAVELLQGVSQITLDGLVELAFDSRLPAFDLLLPELFKAYDVDPRPELAEPIVMLKEWDRRWGTDSVATTVAVSWSTRLLKEARLDPSTPLVPTVARETPPAQLLQTLKDALNRLEADFGRWQLPWGAINRFQRLRGDIELVYDDAQPSVPVGFVTGRLGSLAAFGAGPKEGTKRWYGTRGNSFVAVVEFGERVKARAVTAGGLQNTPGSPHFNDQGERYATGDLREVYFYPDQLEGHIEARYRPGLGELTASD